MATACYRRTHELWQVAVGEYDATKLVRLNLPDEVTVTENWNSAIGYPLYFFSAASVTDSLVRIAAAASSSARRASSQ
jgi:hypothetical protein